MKNTSVSALALLLQCKILISLVQTPELAFVAAMDWVSGCVMPCIDLVNASRHGQQLEAASGSILASSGKDDICAF